MTAAVFTFTEAGGHPVNEDAFEIQRHPSDEGCWFGALADGQGGQAGGGPAARLACRTVMENAARLPPDRLADAATWRGLLELADAAVAIAPDAGFTTLVGFCVRGNAVCGASNGDSALVAVGEADRVLNLTDHQFKNPPVGSRAALIVPFAAKLIGPWMVLAMSDGVWKYVGWERINEAAARFRGQELVDHLGKLARLPGSGRFQDDFTLILLQAE
jgi:hypothetical protein